MHSLRLLDCTLRDGGFINDWDFGFGSIKNIICRLNQAKVDIVEVGFLDQRRTYDKNRSILPDSDSVKPIFENITIDYSMIVGMIDFGTCDLSRITDVKKSVLEGIRVIFKKKDYIDAINFCGELKNKGYKVFVQPVSITSYSETELLKLIEQINRINPYSVSVVDTYGLMHKETLIQYFNIYDKNMNQEIAIGFHSHNNYQLAYSNSLELLSINTNRDMIIDGSLYGMGKGAGNANTELLALYFNKHHNKNYDMDQLLEAIDVDIIKEYNKKYWGYSFSHYLAASNDCHPEYVNFLVNKKTLSIKSINHLLAKIEPSTKLTFNKNLIEDMYSKYLIESIDDSNAYIDLKEELKDDNILIMAPGQTIESHSNEIYKFIKKNNPVVFTVNFLDDTFPVDYVFMGNPKRYSQFFDKINNNFNQPKIICTSNILESGRKIDFKFNFTSLMEKNELIKDNPVLMLLKLLSNLSLNKIYLAGFDGYTPDAKNDYFGEYIQFLYCNDNVLLRNELIKAVIKDLNTKIMIEFLTPSVYID